MYDENEVDEMDQVWIGGRRAVSAAQPAAQGRNRRGRDLCLQTGIFRHGRIDLLPALLEQPAAAGLFLFIMIHDAVVLFFGQRHKYSL